jgi:predicted hydrolase (HD superfamily)
MMNEATGVSPDEIVEQVKAHFLRAVEEGQPIYPFLPRHMREAEKWAHRILRNHPEADPEIVLLSVWLHDIGHTTGDRETDHAHQSALEAERFLTEVGLASEKVRRVVHCVRTHRCRDIQPETMEAKVLAAADSASHMTDVHYIVHASRGARDYAVEKLEKDYRDLGFFPEVQRELASLYEAWRQLLGVYPD